LKKGTILTINIEMQGRSNEQNTCHQGCYSSCPWKWL